MIFDIFDNGKNSSYFESYEQDEFSDIIILNLGIKNYFGFS